MFSVANTGRPGKSIEERLAQCLEERDTQDREQKKPDSSIINRGIHSLNTRSEVNIDLLTPSGVINRQEGPIGTSNISPSGERVPHADILPILFKGVVIEPSYLTSEEWSFEKLTLSRSVTIVTEHEGEELSIPSFITSIDPITKTFCVHNSGMIYRLRPGDSGARVLIDLSRHQSAQVGLVNALAGDQLRCYRRDSQLTEESFPDDLEIFKYQRLSPERLIDLEKKMKSRNQLIIPDKKTIGSWQAIGEHNWDLRDSGLNKHEQLAYAGHLIFMTFLSTAKKLSKKGRGFSIPQAITDFNKSTEAKNTLGKTSIVDASHVVYINKVLKVKLSINADDPQLQASFDGKKVSQIAGPPVPHLGGKITWKLPNEERKCIILHVLVTELDATRIKDKPSGGALFC